MYAVGGGLVELTASKSSCFEVSSSFPFPFPFGSPLDRSEGASRVLIRPMSSGAGLDGGRSRCSVEQRSTVAIAYERDSQMKRRV